MNGLDKLVADFDNSLDEMFEEAIEPARCTQP